MSLLEVKQLRTAIDLPRGRIRPVDGVSFSVGAGETVGLVGESGSGKTMTGMSIIRLLPPGGRIESGQVIFGGRDLMSLGEREMRRIRGSEIGVVFQDPMTSLNPNMTIGNQIAEPLRFHRNASKADALKRAVETLGLVGVPTPAERVGAYPHQLSGGLRQRVMIALALVCEPKLVIADEPTTALDVTIQAQILDLLQSLTSRLGMALILITHDMGVIAGRADRTMVMYSGELVEVAGTEPLFEDTRHPYTEALLESIPRLEQETTRTLYSIPGMPPDLSNLPRGCRFAPRCTYADDQCRAEDPPLAGGGEHLFACFHPRSREGTLEELPNAPSAGIDALHGNGDGRIAAVVPKALARRASGPGPDAGGNGSGTDGPLLEIRCVSKEFLVTRGAIIQRKVGSLSAVTDVTLRLRRGETFGLVGESGCGKTTLGRMAVALERPSAGSVMFEGADLSLLRGDGLRRARRDFQLMFQDPYASLDPRMRVGEIIQEPLDIQEIGDKPYRQEVVRSLLGEVGLNVDAAQNYPHEFSGGQRQRVGLARALALHPKLIVADEPVSALDVSIRSQILNLMKRLQASHGLTYMVISHDLSVVRYLADRVGVMYLGRLVEIGTTSEIYDHPAHPYTAGLLQSIPVPVPKLERTKTGRRIEGELPSSLDPPSGCRFRTRCPRAQERCSVEVPELRAFGGQHEAACHFPLQEPAGAPV